MATTTNYGWGTPDDTDLVKDGALAIRDLGQDIDTTTKALNPETTTGDIAYRSATANTNTRLALGTAGQVLTVNSGATAPEWASPSSGGGMTLLDTVSLSGSSTTSATFSSAYKQLVVFVKECVASASVGHRIRFNGDSGSNYAYHYIEVFGTTNGVDRDDDSTSIRIGYTSNSSTVKGAAYNLFTVSRPSDTDLVFVNCQGFAGFTTGPIGDRAVGVYDSSAAITSITFIPDSGTFSSGTVYIYGVN
jgi:hypothetical protein